MIPGLFLTPFSIQKHGKFGFEKSELWGWGTTHSGVLFAPEYLSVPSPHFHLPSSPCPQLLQCTLMYVLGLSQAAAGLPLRPTVIAD